jgi:hypothetical protein
MGQVIEFRQRRPSSGQDRPNLAAIPASWPLSPAGYAQHVLAPSFAIWRSLVAGYASFWFAPFGIEVKVKEDPPPHPRKARVTSGG